MGLKNKYNNLLLGICRACNLDCTFCCNSEWRLRTINPFPVPLEIVDYFYNRFEFKKIKINGPGETTMCPNITDVLTRTVTLFKGIPVELYSNGLIHDYSWWENIFLEIDRLGGDVKVILSPKVENPQSMEWFEAMPFWNEYMFFKSVLTEDNATLWNSAVSLYPKTMERLLNSEEGHFEVNSNPATNIEQVIKEFEVGTDNAVRGCHVNEDDHSIIVTAWEEDLYIIEQTHLFGGIMRKSHIPGINHSTSASYFEE